MNPSAPYTNATNKHFKFWVDRMQGVEQVPPKQMSDVKFAQMSEKVAAMYQDIKKSEGNVEVKYYPMSDRMAK